MSCVSWKIVQTQCWTCSSLFNSLSRIRTIQQFRGLSTSTSFDAKTFQTSKRRLVTFLTSKRGHTTFLRPQTTFLQPQTHIPSIRVDGCPRHLSTAQTLLKSESEKKDDVGLWGKGCLPDFLKGSSINDVIQKGEGNEVSL